MSVIVTSHELWFLGYIAVLNMLDEEIEKRYWVHVFPSRLLRFPSCLLFHTTILNVVLCQCDCFKTRVEKCSSNALLLLFSS